MRKYRFYSAILDTISPLKIASGANEESDSDILLDSVGKPFIPGTTIAGKIRSYLREAYPDEYGSDAEGRNGIIDLWFGYQVPGKDEGEESRFIFNEAFLHQDTDATISIRDGVSLDEWKAAKSGSKHDYQVLNRGPQFKLRFEVSPLATSAPTIDEKDQLDTLVHRIFSGFNNGDIRLGGKTTRGFGEVKIHDIKEMSYDLDEDSGRQGYIDFTWDKLGFATYEEPLEFESLLYEKRCYKFSNSNYLLIRDYAVSLDAYVDKDDPERNLVDAQQLSEGSSDVLPGPSWAGLFRSQAYKILRRCGWNHKKAQKFVDLLFGYVKNVKTSQSKTESHDALIDEQDKRSERRITASQSNIEFVDSLVVGANGKDTKHLNKTRNAIDRFTNGTANSALFTNQAAYDVEGDREITIRWRRDFCAEASLRGVNLGSLIDNIVKDINCGLAAIGGETSVGGGIVKLVSVVESGDANGS